MKALQHQLIGKRASQTTASARSGGVLQRKCACGGTRGPTGECAMCRRKRELGQQGAAIQTKLSVNNPGGKYEREADRVAEQVMRMPEPLPQRKDSVETEGTEPKPKSLQIRRVTSDGGGVEEAPLVVHDVLRSSGEPLDSATQQLMEFRFNHDFSQVRVHADAQAAESARAINARAYVVGQDVVFGQGEYAPASNRGQRLLAHELVHVVQQCRVPQESRVICRTCSGSAAGFEYDGCSVPDWVVSGADIDDKDNPAGGSDTAFANCRPSNSGGLACDRHDECYQTCHPTEIARAACDLRMLLDMLQICRSSDEETAVKAECLGWASAYHAGLRVGGSIAFWERQLEVCLNLWSNAPGSSDSRALKEPAGAIAASAKGRA